MKVTVTAGNLGQGLQVVSRAVSSRTTLPILNNVLLQTGETGLQLTATNLEIGIRQVIPAEVQEEGGITVPARLLTDFVTSHPDEPLSMALDKKTQSLAVKSNRFDATIRGIDPAHALSELSRILKTGDDGVEVTVGAQKNQVFFKTRDVELMSRLIEGTYPNYQQVIPGQSTTTITSKTQDLLFTTKMVSLFSKDAANVVKFKAEGGKLTLTANTSEVGQNVAGVEATIDGEDLQVAFNSKYLLDVLAIIGSEEVQLGFTGPLNPGLIKPVRVAM